jgi:outer membrane protein insertion porin family
MRRAALLLWAACAAAVSPLSARAHAQEPAPAEPAAQEPAQQGPPATVNPDRPPIESIEILGAPGREAEIRSSLRQKDGAAFDPRGLQQDIQWLWRYRRVRVDDASLRPGLTEGSAILVLQVHAFLAYQRAIFEGNEEYDRAELELRAGLFGQALDIETISQVVRRIESYYRDEGFSHVKVAWEGNDEAGEVLFRITEGPIVRIAELTFEGNDAIPAGGRWYPGLDLAGVVKHKPGFLFISDSVYSETRVQEDVNALQQVYVDYGYRDVKVEFTMAYLDEEQSEVDLTYHIDEGQLYTVRSVSIVSDNGEPLSIQNVDDLWNTNLKPGAPYELARVNAVMAEIVRAYAGIGHPSLARADVVKSREGQFFQIMGSGNVRAPGPRVVFDPELPVVDLIFEIHEGRPRRVRDVIVRGLQRTEDRVARREISVEPGDLANEDELQRSSRRLVGQGIFTDEFRTPFVIPRWRDFGDDQALDLLMDMKDQGSSGQFRIGGAYNTDAGPALILDMEKRNLDIRDLPSSPGAAISEILNGEAFTGAGQTLRLALHPGTEYSTYSLSFTEPDLLEEHINRLSFTASGAKRLRQYTHYDEERGSMGFNLGRRFGRFFTIFAGPTWEEVDVSEVDPGAPAGLVAQEGELDLYTLAFGFRYDTVEDPFSPRDGGSIGMSFGDTGTLLGGDSEYFTASLNLEKFIPIWEDRLARNWVFALRGRVRQGWAGGGADHLPYTEQNYLGGQSSVRGFDYRGIGEDENSFANGGDASWDGSVEVRFPLLSTRQRGLVDEYEWVRGAFFLDAGAYGNTLGDLTPTRAAVGIGIRMRMPLLPLVPFTLDFGWPIASEENDDTRVVSFTLGTF